MDTDTILRNFGRRVVCTQQICTRFAPRLGISRAQALGMGAAFGSAGACSGPGQASRQSGHGAADGQSTQSSQ